MDKKIIFNKLYLDIVYIQNNYMFLCIIVYFDFNERYVISNEIEVKIVFWAILNESVIAK